DPAVNVNRIKTDKRYDQDIVEDLTPENFYFLDISLVHVKDYYDFKLPVTDYIIRYMIGHYSLAGNHIFAYAIKSKLVESLDPMPITYQSQQQQMISFRGYLNYAVEGNLPLADNETYYSVDDLVRSGK